MAKLNKNGYFENCDKEHIVGLISRMSKGNRGNIICYPGFGKTHYVILKLITDDFIGITIPNELVHDLQKPKISGCISNANLYMALLKVNGFIE